MLSIVGTRIYLQEGDSCAFKMMYRNDGDTFNFSATDILTLTIRRIDTNKTVLVKTAESIKVNGEESLVFIFEPTELSHGDYKYDIVLDASTGYRHTLIDKAYFNVLKSKSPVSLPGGEFTPRRLDSMETERMCMSSTPLVCDFKYSSIMKEEVPGTLILFDRIKRKKEDPETDEDTLILYDQHLKPESEKDEGTLIIF